MNAEEYNKKMSQLIAKCWADEGFKRKLLADPAATLKAEGAEVPPGLSIKALENTDKMFHPVIPAKPADLSDEELGKVVGGAIRQNGGGSGSASSSKPPPLPFPSFTNWF